MKLICTSLPPFSKTCQVLCFLGGFGSGLGDENDEWRVGDGLEAPGETTHNGEEQGDNSTSGLVEASLRGEEGGESMPNIMLEMIPNISYHIYTYVQ